MDEKKKLKWSSGGLEFGLERGGERLVFLKFYYIYIYFFLFSLNSI